MAKWYGFRSLIGGVPGSLDLKDGTNLLDEDIAEVAELATNLFRIYKLDATSGASENSPWIISPDTNAGTKRWILVRTLPASETVNLIKNSGNRSASNSTLENVGSNLISSWVNTSYDVFASSGADITNAEKTGAGDQFATSTISELTEDQLYLLVSDLTMVGGQPPYIQVGAVTVSLAEWTVDGVNSFLFRAKSGADSITIFNNAVAEWSADFTLYKVEAGFVAANTLAFDGHSKETTLLAYKSLNVDNTYGAGQELIRLVKGVDGPEYYNFDDLFSDYRDLQDRAVAFAAKVYSVSAADNVKLSIHDGNSEIALSESYAAADVLDVLKVSGFVSDTASKVQPRILLDGDTGDVAYVSFEVLKPGDSIGDDDYIQPAGEVVLCEAHITPASYSSATVSANTLIDLELESLGKISANCKEVGVKGLQCKCASIDKFIFLESASSKHDGIILPSSVVNVNLASVGAVQCNAQGNIFVRRTDTFTAVTIRITSIRVS